MQLSHLLGLAAAVSAVTVSYDTGYDDAGRSLTAVSCSDGEHGLITRKHWQTQGQVHGFPYIGGADAIAGWNSPNCGSCWRLEYNGRAVTILALDHAGSGFNIALQAMDALTGGNAVQFGRVDATATRLPESDCGM